MRALTTNSTTNSVTKPHRSPESIAGLWLVARPIAPKSEASIIRNAHTRTKPKNVRQYRLSLDRVICKVWRRSDASTSSRRSKNAVQLLDLDDKQRKLEARLNEDGSKPKWMRARSYEAIQDRIVDVEEARDLEFTAGAARLLARLGVTMIAP